MSQQRITKDESEKGWSFDLKRVQIDLFHMLSIFLAENKYASILIDENDPLWSLASFGEPEITRILINSAVVGRVIDDREDRFLSNCEAFCGELLFKEKTEGLNLREAFNKIIHAKAFDLVINKTDGQFHYIEPIIYLHGYIRENKWEAKLDIIAYIREYNRNIVGVEKDEQFT